MRPPCALPVSTRPMTRPIAERAPRSRNRSPWSRKRLSVARYGAPHVAQRGSTVASAHRNRACHGQMPRTVWHRLGASTIAALPAAHLLFCLHSGRQTCCSSAAVYAAAAAVQASTRHLKADQQDKSYGQTFASFQLLDTTGRSRRLWSTIAHFHPFRPSVVTLSLARPPPSSSHHQPLRLLSHSPPVSLALEGHLGTRLTLIQT